MAKTKPKTKKIKTRQKPKASKPKASRKVQKRSAAGKSRQKAPSASGGRGKKAPARRGKAKRVSTARSAKRKTARSKARRPAPPQKSARQSPPAVAKPVAKKPTRLPPRKRHIVESDEPRERVGDADDKAFVGTDTTEDEAQELGEEFVRSVTSGEEAESEMEEEEAIEEQGGPFVVTSASTEFGFGTDASNPVDAEKAPFPQVSPAVSPRTDGEDEDQ
jgi:hypothetical protein